jgi:glycosyltransferase involved in cell wall biosynthesis
LKILHISTSDSGGAGLCCVRLHKGLLVNGFDSKVLVLSKVYNEPAVYEYQKKAIKLPKIIRWPILFLKLVLHKLRIPASQLQYFQYKLDNLQRISSPVYTLPFSEYDLSAHPLVREADLIHLHWTAGFLDWPGFFRQTFKPVIWTVHDENIYYGGFHYNKDQRDNISVYRKLEEKLIEIKQKSINRCKNLAIVSLSNMMLEISLSYNIVKERKHYVIHNSVDHRTFRPFDKHYCRDLFNLPQSKKVLLFVSYYLNDKHKGLTELVMALNELNLSDITLCAIGIGKAEIDTPVEIYYPGAINDPRLLTLAYSAADIYVTPSFQEAFAQIPLEAMACGLPVVTFPVSGSLELINEKNGVRADDFTVEAFKEGILKAIKTDYDAEWIRQDVIARFGVKNITEQYAGVYKELLNS